MSAQTGPAAAPVTDEVQKLAAEQRWQEIVLLLEPMSSRSADLNFYYGTALARLERWHEADAAFQSGLRLAPYDPRFLIELAGVAFKQRRYSQAAGRLRQALKLSPHDSYANDFLGTIYFLQANLDGSLKYWNRVGKPQVAELRLDPPPHVSPVLLDRAFAFSPAGMLQRSGFHATDARIRSLGIFPHYQLDLRAREEDDQFDVSFRNQERNGFGSTKWEGLFLLFRGLPFLTVTPEYYNLHREAINLVSLFRWDPDKRRAYVQFSSPFQHTAKYRYEIAADLRNENWTILNSDASPSPPLARLNLRRELLGFSLASFASGRWQWSAGAEFSHRDFRSVVAGNVLTPPLADGYELKQLAELRATLWRMPERRFALEAEVSSQAARLWSRPVQTSEKLQSSLGWHWFPRAQGDDFEMQQRFRSGKTFGTVPFDELFMLGLERDNDLPMRAHIGTHDGRKGSAPLGRNYFLANWEIDKNLYGNGIVTLKIGPFLDTGKITDSLPTLGSRKWLCDTGAQIKLRVFGTGVAFSYGKDVRSGNNTYYLTMLK